MCECNQIPAAAWQQLEGATWQKLTEVNFGWRLGEDTFRSVRGFSRRDGCWAVEGVRDFEVAGTRPFHKERVV